MVAVCRAGHGHARGDIANLRAPEVGEVERASEPALSLLQKNAGNGIGAAKRLEAAEPQATSFILDMEGAHPQGIGQGRQAMERGRRVLLPMGEVTLDLLCSLLPQDFGITRIEGFAVVWVPVELKHSNPSSCNGERIAQKAGEVRFLRRAGLIP